MTRSDRNRWFSLLFIDISLLVISLDNTILNVALPTIAQDLGASASDLQWIVDAYILVFASLLLTMGSIGDRVGRKKALQVGLGLFGLGSLGAGLATSTEMLTAMRAFMGVGGAVIMPATLSIVTATFRDPRERSQAIAIWASVFGLGVGLGPVIGGWLLEHFDWGAVFLVNLPITLTAIVGDHWVVKESKDESVPPPDILGALLSIAGLFALVYGIIEAGVDGWTAPHVLQAFGAALVLLSLFAWWEHRTPNPMLPVRFFSNMSFTGANLALVLTMFSMFGSLFFMSQYFQSVQSYGALESGLRLLPMSLVIMTTAAMSARVSGRLGLKVTVGSGLLVSAIGVFYISQVATLDASYETVLVGLCVVGVGLGLTMSPATDSVMGSVPVSKAGVGSAMNDTTRMVGGALGVAVLGTIMNNVYLDKVEPLLNRPIREMLPNPAQFESMLSNLPTDKLPDLGQGGSLLSNTLAQLLPPEAVDAIRSSVQGAHLVADRLPIPLAGQMIADETSRAFVTGMSDALVVATFIMVGASMLTFVILPSRVRRSREQEPESAGQALTSGEVALVHSGQED